MGDLLGIGSIVGGVLGAGASTYGANKSLQMTRETNAMNWKIAQQAFENDKEMWRMQNEYNSPKNQMARFKDAGINPHLAFGSMSAGNATNMPTMSTPKMESGAHEYGMLMQGVGDRLSNLALQVAQIENVNADTKKKVAETKTEGYRPQLLSEEILNRRAVTDNYLARTIGQRLKNNVDNALQAVDVAIGYQKLDNLSVQEKDIMSQIAYREVQADLARSNISMHEFEKALREEEFKLKKRVADYEYSLRYDSNAIDRYNAETARLRQVSETKRWVHEYNLSRFREKSLAHDRDRNYNLRKGQQYLDNRPHLNLGVVKW